MLSELHGRGFAIRRKQTKGVLRTPSRASALTPLPPLCLVRDEVRIAHKTEGLDISAATLTDLQAHASRYHDSDHCPAR